MKREKQKHVFNTIVASLSFSLSLAHTHTAIATHTYIHKYRCAITVTMYLSYVWKSALLWPLCSYLSTYLQLTMPLMMKCLRCGCMYAVLKCHSCEESIYLFFIQTETIGTVVVWWCWCLCGLRTATLYHYGGYEKNIYVHRSV